MNRKYQIIIDEPLLLIAFPFSIISLLFIIIARPFILVRVGFLRCDRIGHFAANTELYLCERDYNNLGNKTLDLFYYPRKVCNQQLAKMWERRLHVLPWFLLRPLCLIIRSFNCFASHRVYDARGGDRDLDNLLDSLPPHLSFTEKELERGEAGLREMGIPNSAPFVCLTVRDNAYLANLYKGADNSFHDYRDSDVQKYILAAEELANRGYFVIRMGVKVREAIASSHPNVIDYATNGMRSDFMDIYLGAKCLFCISVGTGFDAVPLIFRRPIAYVNMVPLGYLFTFSYNFLGITKHHFSVQFNRELTLREIFDNNVGFCLDSSAYNLNGVSLVENTPEEILDLVIEMEERLTKKWQSHKDDECLQTRFWEIYPVDAVDSYQQKQLHGEIRTRFGAAFLRNNSSWLN